MQQKQQIFIPISIVFVVVTIVSLVFSTQLNAFKINQWVVIGSNTILFVFSLYNVVQHNKAMQQTNPHAMIRGVMGSVILKLFVLGTAAFVYLYNAGENKNMNGLFIGMALYILYTWLDVRIGLIVKPTSKDGSN
ncbi:MAG: hypothetical protein NT153_08790 [Bacteroidetes bacterium]|nr:hypothetical protein [Bacteroidota bacterium]